MPRTVSGTFKSYQYRDPAGVECDGHVLQNTVWTPNHRYLGSDVDLLTRRTVDVDVLPAGARGRRGHA